MDEIGEQTSSRRGSLHCRRVFADEVDFRSTRAASGKWPEIPPPGKTAARLEPRRQSGFAAAAKRFCRGGKAVLPRLKKRLGLKNRLLFPFISMKGSGFAAFGENVP